MSTQEEISIAGMCAHADALRGKIISVAVCSVGWQVVPIEQDVIRIQVCRVTEPDRIPSRLKGVRWLYRIVGTCPDRRYDPARPYELFVHVESWCMLCGE